MTKSPKTDRLREMREAKVTVLLSPKQATAHKVTYAPLNIIEKLAKQEASKENGKKGGKPKRLG